jgi:membrane-associated protease RseP (regulator of RpoE activity)
MKTSAWNATLLTALLLAPAGLARGNDQQPPAPPAPPAASVGPDAPAAPVPPAAPAPRARTKKVVVASPEKQAVVDGDRVYISGGDDEDVFADVDGFDDGDVRPFVFRMPGSSGGGFIGIQPVDMTPDLRQHFGAPRDAGVFVGSVEADSPAAKAGLQVGDIVTKVDGDVIGSTRELVRLVRHRKGGESIAVDVLRNKAAKTLTVTVAERKGSEVRIGELPEKRHGHDGAGSWKSFVTPLGLPPDFERRLDELEKKLRELEDRLPAR